MDKKQLILILTRECDFSCSYCPVKKERGAKMSWEIARKSLELFDEMRGEKIKFFGGEPLLEFDLIKKIVEYQAEKRRGTKYELTTNGHLLDENKIEFMLKNDFDIHVSIDGDEETQILGRGNLGRGIERSVVKYAKNITVNMVVSPRNVHRFPENVSFLHSQGYDKFKILPAFYNKWKMGEIIAFVAGLREVSKYVKENIINIMNKRTVQKNILFNDGYVVDTDGSIYPDNRIMAEKYTKFKKTLLRGNMNDIRSFSDLDEKEVRIFTDFEKTNQILDRCMAVFVRSVIK